MGGFAEVAVNAAAADAIAALNQYPLDPLHVFTGGTLALILGWLRMRTAFRGHRRRLRIGSRAAILDIINDGRRQHAPLFPVAIPDLRLHDAVVEPPGFNGVFAVQRDANVTGAPDDQAGRLGNGGNGAGLFAQLEQAVGRFIRATVAVLGSRRAIFGPEEALDLSDTVGDHAAFLDVPSVGSHPARGIVSGILPGLGVQQGLGGLIAHRAVPVLPSGGQRPLGELHLLEIIVVCHMAALLSKDRERDPYYALPVIRVGQFQFTVPVPVVTISPLASSGS